MLEPLAKKLRSRKFLLTLFVVLIGVLNTVFDLEIEPAAIATIGGTIAAWVFTEGGLDKERIKSEHVQRFTNLQNEANQVVQGLQGQLEEAQSFIQNLMAEQAGQAAANVTPEEFASVVAAVADEGDGSA